jgi:hypothetical protein
MLPDIDEAVQPAIALCLQHVVLEILIIQRRSIIIIKRLRRKKAEKKTFVMDRTLK